MIWTLYTGRMYARFDRLSRLTFPAFISKILIEGENRKVFLFYNEEKKYVGFKRANELDIDHKSISAKISIEKNKSNARITIPKPLLEAMQIDTSTITGKKLPLHFITEEDGTKMVMVYADFSAAQT